MIVCVLVVAMNGMLLADTFGTGANQFDIDFVNISGATNPTSGYGIVNNDYRMGTYEITNDQWNKFSASLGVSVTGSPLNAYDESADFAGTNVPTNELSWYEAAQLVNWLNTSTNHHEAYKFTGTQGTSDYTLGVWESGDIGYDSSNPFRNSDAYYFLPTEDEWVKTAYWNGTSIQPYATKSGESLSQGDGTTGTGWNYYDGDFVIDPFGVWDVGSGSVELNGTYDMMGNVGEWFESPWTFGDYSTTSPRGIRGGSYGGNESYLSSSGRSYSGLNTEYNNFGFRVASIPEPATTTLLAFGGIALIRRKRTH